MDSIWTWMNEPVGLTVIGGAIAFLLGWLFTKKPTWEKYYTKYKGTIVQAIQYAEKAIPDDTENKSMKKLDEAMKYMIKLNPKLENADENALVQALHVLLGEQKATDK